MQKPNNVARTNRIRSQDGARIRELREKRQLRQTEFAEHINGYMRELLPGLPVTEALTQTMVSDLELGNANLSVLQMFVISSFFGVPPGELLETNLKSIGKSEINIGTAGLPDCRTAGLPDCRTAGLPDCRTNASTPPLFLSTARKPLGRCFSLPVRFFHF